MAINGTESAAQKVMKKVGESFLFSVTAAAGKDTAKRFGGYVAGTNESERRIVTAEYKNEQRGELITKLREKIKKLKEDLKNSEDANVCKIVLAFSIGIVVGGILVKVFWPRSGGGGGVDRRSPSVVEIHKFQSVKRIRLVLGCETAEQAAVSGFYKTIYIRNVPHFNTTVTALRGSLTAIEAGMDDSANMQQTVDAINAFLRRLQSEEVEIA